MKSEKELDIDVLDENILQQLRKSVDCIIDAINKVNCDISSDYVVIDLNKDGQIIVDGALLECEIKKSSYMKIVLNGVSESLKDCLKIFISGSIGTLYCVKSKLVEAVDNYIINLEPSDNISPITIPLVKLFFDAAADKAMDSLADTIKEHTEIKHQVNQAIVDDIHKINELVNSLIHHEIGEHSDGYQKYYIQI